VYKFLSEQIMLGNNDVRDMYRVECENNIFNAVPWISFVCEANRSTEMQRWLYLCRSHAIYLLPSR
jgi:hypothetical protein